MRSLLASVGAGIVALTAVLAEAQAPPAAAPKATEQAAAPVSRPRAKVWRGKGPKPYEPPILDPEPALAPSQVAVVEARGEDVGVFARPWYPSPRVGTLAPRARLTVRGEVAARPQERLCPKAVWYAVEPFGYLCSRHGRPTTSPPTSELAMKVPAGERLPYRYGMVRKGKTARQYESRDDIDAGQVQRQLEQNDTVAILGHPLMHNEVKYWRTADGRLVEAENLAMMGPGSAWQGLKLDANRRFPFAFVRTADAKVREAPEAKAKVVGTLALRSTVEVVEEAGTAKQRFWKLGEGRFVAAADLKVVRKIAPPAGVLTSPEKQWIDVDLGEQVMVLYEDTVPVYATMVSTGLKVKTPRGNYPIWARVLSVTMKNQQYEDGAYHMARVPWTNFFQTHNAVHGCYWHDRYGHPTSHGCVNTAPLDARYVFEWIKPKLPPGWYGIRPANLLESVTVHVRNSRLSPAFKQERPIGPPDKEEEKKKLELAEKRRAEKEVKEAQEAAAKARAAGTQGPPAAPTPGLPAP